MDEGQEGRARAPATARSLGESSLASLSANTPAASRFRSPAESSSTCRRVISGACRRVCPEIAVMPLVASGEQRLANASESSGVNESARARQAVTRGLLPRDTGDSESARGERKLGAERSRGTSLRCSE